MEFNNIGYFQFDNLLQNRVPFILVLLDEVDLKSLYNNSLINLHIQNITLQYSSGKILEAIQDKKLPPHFAIIILDKDERKSPKIAKEIEKAGYTNVYYVKNGFEGLLTERKQ